MGSHAVHATHIGWLNSRSAIHFPIRFRALSILVSLKAFIAADVTMRQANPSTLEELQGRLFFFFLRFQPPPPPPMTIILSNAAEKLTTRFVDYPPPFLQHVFPCPTMHSIAYTAYFVFYKMT